MKLIIVIIWGITHTIAFSQTKVLSPVTKQRTTPKHVFVTGGAQGIKALTTSWPGSSVFWLVQSEAGKIASDVSQADAKGQISLEFNVPDVRIPVHLALVLNSVNVKPEDSIMVDVVVLPNNPFADVKDVLDKLDIGLLSGGKLADVLKKNSLNYTPLQHDVARNNFKGKIIVLDSLLNNNLEATRTWIESLPAETSIILVNNGNEKLLLSLANCLSEQSGLNEAKIFWDKKKSVWTGLMPEWFGTQHLNLKLGELKYILSFRLLAGRIAKDGTIFPLLLETYDIDKHHWLIWNIPNSFGDDDPRWDLILRNSLLWAHSRISSDKQPEEDNTSKTRK